MLLFSSRSCLVEFYLLCFVRWSDLKSCSSLCCLYFPYYHEVDQDPWFLCRLSSRLSLLCDSRYLLFAQVYSLILIKAQTSHDPSISATTKPLLSPTHMQNKYWWWSHLRKCALCTFLSDTNSTCRSSSQHLFQYLTYDSLPTWIWYSNTTCLRVQLQEFMHAFSHHYYGLAWWSRKLAAFLFTCSLTALVYAEETTRIHYGDREAVRSIRRGILNLILLISDLYLVL